MPVSEIIDLLRLLGVGNALRMNKRYSEAQPVVRGYVATRVLWSLVTCGLADRLLAEPSIDIKAFADERKLNHHVLGSILSYLDGISLVRVDDGRVRLLDKGRHFLDDTRGLFELTYAYEPLFVNLDDLLAGRVAYGTDVDRRIEYVGRGSGLLCRDLPYPVMADMIRRHGCRRVLDLGCGDLALARFLCERLPEVTVLGIDIDPEMVAYSRDLLAGRPEGAGRITVTEGDLRALDPLIASGQLDGVDCITAVDTFHEYLWNGTEEIVAALGTLRTQFPRALFVIGEFCNQPHEQLRRRPTAFLEHHLFHDLTNQKIGDADLWRRLFAEAGFTLVEERIFNLVGHGYFVLKP